MRCTAVICASDRQVLPVSAPPAQRSVAFTVSMVKAALQAAMLPMMPSVRPSSPSQAPYTALTSNWRLLSLIQPAPPLSYSARPTSSEACCNRERL